MRDTTTKATEPEPAQEKSLEEIMEERRRKRAAILARHASGQSSVAAFASGITTNMNSTGTSVPPQTPSGVVGDALSKISVKDGSVPPGKYHDFGICLI